MMKARTGLHVVHVITEARPMGGAQLNTFYSLRWQATHHTVALVAGCPGPMVNSCREEGIPVRVIPMRNRLLDPLGDARALVALVRYLRSARPDVVHTHSSKAGVLGRVAARLARVPVVVHTVHASSYSPRSSPLVRGTLRLMERALARMTDRLVCVARSIETEMVADGVCRPDQVCTIVSGLDLDRLDNASPDARERVRAALGIPSERTVAVSVGQLFSRKNHELLIDAAAEVPDITVLIVGEGPAHDDLAERIAARGVSDRVILCGRRDDVPDILAASDIAVQTSWHEGLSRSLLEAMYAGLPVIATAVGATDEVVHDGRGGFLFSPDDREALVRHLRTLTSDPERRAELGRAARQAVAGDRSIAAMGRGLDELYGLLIRPEMRPRARAVSDA